ncbi:CLUMA_CG019187, isoform A [Clunio marinus]|uniref:CLUMA_CG019187, isoform A n=1 Tax=Clunio marinus TaxID=568069 RepID=A0A1J1J2D2_9DIPT|nr:CLUMA_CG019187, isoform A [Clunio marinus]
MEIRANMVAMSACVLHHLENGFVDISKYFLQDLWLAFDIICLQLIIHLHILPAMATQFTCAILENIWEDEIFGASDKKHIFVNRNIKDVRNIVSCFCVFVLRGLRFLFFTLFTSSVGRLQSFSMTGIGHSKLNGFIVNIRTRQFSLAICPSHSSVELKTRNKKFDKTTVFPLLPENKFAWKLAAKIMLIIYATIEPTG